MSDKPRVVIQVAMMQDGKIAVSSTSQNQVTNLGLIGVAQSLFMKGVEETEKSRIIQPEIVQ